VKYEYLIFNIIVIVGPLFFGSLKKFYFLNRIKETLISISVPLIPFLVWDALVTGRHWYFNEEYVIGIYFFGLPIEEIMFFLTVPFACIFTWEMLNRFMKGKSFTFPLEVYFIPAIFPLLSVYLFIIDKEYTALVFAALTLVFIYDRLLGTKFFIMKSTPIYISLIIVFTVIFNGYLTWRPVVTYNEYYQLGFRIITIPIEDFLFGLSLLLISTITYVKLTSGKK